MVNVGSVLVIGSTRAKYERLKFLEDTVADPELNLGGGGSRGPKSRVGRLRGGVSPPARGGSGRLPPPPEKILKKNDAN